MGQEATPELVLSFLDLAEPIPVWIDGGWGVDALLGRQTRPHSDLDIIIADHDSPTLQSRLADSGYQEDPAQEGLVFISPEGLSVDVHCVRFDSEGYGNFDLPDGRVWPLPPAAFRGAGRIAGVGVKCLSPEAQVQCHAQGYEPTEKDLSDMSALQKKYEVVLPLSLCSQGVRRDA